MVYIVLRVDITKADITRVGITMEDTVKEGITEEFIVMDKVIDMVNSLEAIDMVITLEVIDMVITLEAIDKAITLEAIDIIMVDTTMGDIVIVGTIVGVDNITIEVAFNLDNIKAFALELFIIKGKQAIDTLAFNQFIEWALVYYQGTIHIKLKFIQHLYPCNLKCTSLIPFCFQILIIKQFKFLQSDHPLKWRLSPILQCLKYVHHFF